MAEKSCARCKTFSPAHGKCGLFRREFPAVCEEYEPLKGFLPKERTKALKKISGSQPTNVKEWPGPTQASRDEGIPTLLTAKDAEDIARRIVKEELRELARRYGLPWMI